VKPVERSEIVDYVTYEEGRNAFRDQVLAAKALRRINIGEHLTLLVENPLTVRYQIQEMIRAERIVKEADIRHEIDTYNELLGGPGEFGCTLLIELDDPGIRDEKLREWWTLPEKTYLLLEDGTHVWARFDERQRGHDRVSSVQYLKFDTAGRVPVAAGVDLPQLKAETRLTEEQRQALRADLES
jgi:TusA-related sulfurtransferase